MLEGQQRIPRRDTFIFVDITVMRTKHRIANFGHKDISTSGVTPLDRVLGGEIGGTSTPRYIGITTTVYCYARAFPAALTFDTKTFLLPAGLPWIGFLVGKLVE